MEGLQIVVEVIGGAMAVAAVVVILVTRILRARGERAEQRKLQRLTDGRDPRAAPALVAAGRLREAADLLIAQGDFRGAARVTLKMGNASRAAELFERVEDHEAAANAYMRIPDFRRAADCLSRVGKHDRAAEIYLQVGDQYTAAQELETGGLLAQAAQLHRQMGNELLAAQLEARALRASGSLLEAATAYARAGDNALAAECWAEAGRFREAAKAWLLAGRPDQAAAALERAGDVAEAAALYEEAGDHAAAARLYGKVQNPQKEIEALVAGGDLLAAGQLAFKLGDLAKAEEILMLATPADRGYARICFLLGHILREAGRRSEAARWFALFVERSLPTDRTANIFRALAGELEREGSLDAARRALQKLSKARLLDDAGRMDLDRLGRLAESGPGPDPGGAGSSVPRDHRDFPDLIADRYRLSRRLGEGGTAIVYLAHDPMLKRDVVVKFLSNPSLPGDLAEDYFIREAQIVAGLSHPNIVHVFDVGSAAGRSYMIMEYLEGETLESLLQRSTRGLPADRVARMAAEVGAALEYAHERKVIHRDVKPGNIMVLPDGQAKLMDFGMAKALEIHRTRSLYICGTPDYMSPEQERGLDLTPTTDIYSFGLVVMEALLGVLPVGPTAQATRFVRLEQLERSDLSSAVKRTLARCLDLDPDQRPASAREVAFAINPATGSARP